MDLRECVTEFCRVMNSCCSLRAMAVVAHGGRHALHVRLLITVLGATSTSSSAFAQSPIDQRGQRAFGACAACHALEPNRNMTGPSLADLWNRQAGSLQSFDRYSSALKSSGIIWDNKSLDEWIKDPQRFVPGNHMTFPESRTRVPEPI
jgi:cytochrome c2